MEKKRIHFRCPRCDKVSYFQPGEPVACRRCGAKPVADDASATHGAPTQRWTPIAQDPGTPSGSTVVVMQQQQQGGGSGGGRTAAIVALVTGILAFLAAFVFPFSLIFALAATISGGVAIAQAGDDSTSTALGAVGLVLGVLVLFITLMMFFAVEVYAEGSSGGGGSGEPEGGGSSGGSDGSGGGGSGGSGGGSGADGGGGSGSDGGGGAGGEEAPAWGTLPLIACIGLLAWWRR